MNHHREATKSDAFKSLNRKEAMYRHREATKSDVFQSLKNIFDFTTAGDWDCVAAVERLPALYYSVDFIFFSFGVMSIIAKL